MSDNAIISESPTSIFARIGLPFLGRKSRGDGTPKRRRRFQVGRARWITLAMLAAFMIVRQADPPVLELLRLKTFDFYQQIKPRPLMADSPVVIIDLDEESLREIGQWPWPRNIVAQMVQNLFRMGVGVVGFDMFFPEPDRMSGKNVAQGLVGLDAETKKKLTALKSNDQIFGRIIRAGGRVVVGQAVLNNERIYEGRKPLPGRVGQRQEKGAQKPETWVRKVPGLLRNVPEIENAAAGHGLVSLEPEPDGIVRRIPAFFYHGTKLYPALSMEMMRVAGGRSSMMVQSNLSGIANVKIIPRKRFLVNRAIITDKSISKQPHVNNFNRILYAILHESDDVKYLVRRAALGKTKLQRYKKNYDRGKFILLELPEIKPITDRFGRMWPYFSKSDVNKYVPAKDVLSGVVDPKRIAGKLAIIGTSAQGLLDIKTVPTARFIPGVEIHAQLIESVLTKSFLTRPNFADAAEMALALFGGLIVIILVPWVGAKWTLLFFLIVAGGAGGTSWYLFSEHKVLIDAVFATAAIFVIYVTLTYMGYASEEAARRRTRDAFSKYLSPAVVQQVVEDPSMLTLGGSKRDMTLLFCDVRGFTRISELFDAEGLTVLINKLLTPLTDIILAHQGTVDKYMGDCIMAFWNAPLDDPNHAKNGCISALKMVAAMAPLNESLRLEAIEEGRKHLPLKVGLGLNSGEAVVGNMGTAQRMDYSVLGDTVNTAARLEGQSKTYGVDIVIGPNTYDQIHEDFATIPLDNIQVKGKTVGLLVYALMGFDELAANAEFIEVKKAVEDMINDYRDQDWRTARLHMARLRTIGEPYKLGVLCDLYEARIKEYEANPPGEDWDGVFIATTK